MKCTLTIGPRGVEQCAAGRTAAVKQRDTRVLDLFAARPDNVAGELGAALESESHRDLAFSFASAGLDNQNRVSDSLPLDTVGVCHDAPTVNGVSRGMLWTVYQRHQRCLPL